MNFISKNLEYKNTQIAFLVTTKKPNQFSNINRDTPRNTR